jgi:mRNA interferase HigB
MLSSRLGNFGLQTPLCLQIVMRVISRKTLKEFYERHAAAKASLESWFHEAKAAEWKNPTDITARFPSADFLPGNRVVFDIAGNHYRLIARIHYNTGIVFVRFVGTHAAYDKIDAATV